jgi:hypothetical protein
MFQMSNSVAAPTGWYNAGGLLAGLRRVNLFFGGFGSGKTEVAVNFCVRMRQASRRVAIADIDIVNPYFRSREVRREMRDLGIDVLIPEETLVDADLPVIKPEVQGALETSPGLVVMDVGGDPAGARVVASMARLLKKDDYTAHLVLNSRRPFTATVEGALKMMRGIGDTAGLAITSIVANSHLVDETTPEVIDEGVALAERLAAATGAEVAFASVMREMLDRFDAARCGCPVMVMDRFMLPPWRLSERLGRDQFKLT